MRFLAMGDNVVDRYVNKNKMFPGGNAVNVAVYVARCGETSAYLGVIADDREGRLIRDSLISLGVNVDKSPLVQGCATERCDVKLEEGDRIFQGCSLGEPGKHRPLRLTDEHMEYIKSFDVVHCGCYAYMEDEMKKLEGVKAFRTFDFSAEEDHRSEDYLKKICPYIDMALFSAENLPEEERKALVDRVTGFGTKYVLITDGKRGQVLYDGEKSYRGKVKLVEPVDTMGAGDSFFASFVVSIMRNGYLETGELTEENLARSFDFAADFSADNCMMEGAFGCGVPIEE